MLLKNLINKSVYGTIGYIKSQDDLDLLEQYIVYNYPVLQEYQQVIVATNYSAPLQDQNATIWKHYFANCIIVDSKVNRGHSFGTADLDNMIFEYCKENSIEWLCKSANDMILQESILDKQIDEADFYYINGVGYAGMVAYDFDIEKIITEDFYPQTNFYFINTDKVDYLNDKNHINEVYEKTQNTVEYNGRAWEYGFKSCEGLLKECIERNNLRKCHLITKQKYIALLQTIRNNTIHDSSYKNTMVEGICHYHSNTQQVLVV